MPEEELQERTQPATPRRRRRAKERGEVAKSAEINSILILLCSFLILRFFGKGITQRLSQDIGYILENAHKFSLCTSEVYKYFQQGLWEGARMLFPLILMIAIAGLVANLMQTGFLFTFHPLVPDLNRINPVNGFKRIFSKRSLVQLLFSLLKMAVIGYVVYILIKTHSEDFLLLVDKDIGQICAFVFNLAFQLGLYSCLALAPIAVLDYGLQRWEYEKRLRMTRQEALEEYKETEGNPLVKTRIRSLQRQMARRRMMQEVPRADVVITNPTQLAVALQYNREKMNAPVVVAKGARYLAERIKRVARDHNVPIVENRWLAKALYESVEVGQEIPIRFYQAVAEVLAYIYRLKKRYI